MINILNVTFFYVNINTMNAYIFAI